MAPIPPPEMVNLVGKVNNEKYIPATPSQDSVYEFTLFTEKGVKAINVIDDDHYIMKENVDYLLRDGMDIEILNIEKGIAENWMFLSVHPNSIRILNPKGEKAEAE